LAGKLSWDVTTTYVNSALHPSGVAKSSTSFCWGEGGKVTTAEWQTGAPICSEHWGDDEWGRLRLCAKTV